MSPCGHLDVHLRTLMQEQITWLCMAMHGYAHTLTDLWEVGMYSCRILPIVTPSFVIWISDTSMRIKT